MVNLCVVNTGEKLTYRPTHNLPHRFCSLSCILSIVLSILYFVFARCPRRIDAVFVQRGCEIPGHPTLVCSTLVKVEQQKTQQQHRGSLVPTRGRTAVIMSRDRLTANACALLMVFVCSAHAQGILNTLKLEKGSAACKIVLQGELARCKARSDFAICTMDMSCVGESVQVDVHQALQPFIKDLQGVMRAKRGFGCPCWPTDVVAHSSLDHGGSNFRVYPSP